MYKNMDTGDLLQIFPKSLRDIFGEKLPFSALTEIRLRAGLPILVSTLEESFFIDEAGNLFQNPQEVQKKSKETGGAGTAFFTEKKISPPVRLSPEELGKIFEKITEYSVFAHREEIGEGFITLKGGHRAGLCGRYYYGRAGEGRLKNISSINIRIAREVPGCAAPIFPHLFEEQKFCHTLLISPPGRGKTTCLRDTIRLLSDGWGAFFGRNVSVVDERGEIGNRTSAGEGFYLGNRTDLIDHCPKAEGLLMLLRTMTPDVIAADEIGGKNDIDALGYIRNCGCKLLMTVHGSKLEELYKRPVLGAYLKEFPFERYVLLGERRGREQKVEIYNGSGEKTGEAAMTLHAGDG